ncbi:MAG: Flp family type IVb pilin [Chlorobiaceae bacterium]|nr:Flp family type IVb pilin [Chlorobiaceae bacterium]
MLNQFFPIESQKGVTMIEYALIAALVAVVAITALTTLGGNLSTIFTDIATALSGTGGSTTTP